MKNFGKLSINPAKAMRDEELLNLRGGEQYATRCCYASGTTQGTVSFCSDNPDLLNAWANFWAVNYSVSCQTMQYA